tara:strand:+ start:1793 stop:2401 length:609 start_codon:yes stop_codon:yes gene_type:complete
MSDDKLIKAIQDFKNSLGQKGVTQAIHGKDYATVAPRIAILRRNLGKNLDIRTTLLHHDEKRVVVQAHGYIDGFHVASGLAEEFRAASRINNTSALENCETSAIGRMAAFLAMTNDNIASATEVDQAINTQNRIVESEKRLNSALVDLGKVSHIGSYNSWISDNKNLMQDLKDLSPKYYSDFLVSFNKIKTQLETKGIVKNG